MSDPNLPSERYKLLVLQLRDELGASYGWKAAAAKALGVAPSYVSKIDAGKAGSVGPDIIRRAMERLALPRSWFYDDNYGAIPGTIPREDGKDRHYTWAQNTAEASRLAREAEWESREELRKLAGEIVHSFTSGKGDIGAVRDLARMVLDPSPYRTAHRLLASDDDALRREGTQFAMEVLMSTELQRLPTPPKPGDDGYGES